MDGFTIMRNTFFSQLPRTYVCHLLPPSTRLHSQVCEELDARSLGCEAHFLSGKVNTLPSAR